VTVRYGTGEAGTNALHDVDLEIAEHESTALLGRSGSGKTTLLHVLGGLVRPTSGSVTRRTHAIGYVFQGANLLPVFTAYENVAFAAELAPGARRAPQELLELVGLGRKADHLPAELSGGEAQRVAIARALAQEPELLLCDEPTGHLDSDTGERVLDLIEALQQEVGFALVLATHDIDIGARLQREVELHDGRVVLQEEVG
jgi:putative ABC transport system ATP-binding protein